MFVALYKNKKHQKWRPLRGRGNKLQFCWHSPEEREWLQFRQTLKCKNSKVENKAQAFSTHKIIKIHHECKTKLKIFIARKTTELYVIPLNCFCFRLLHRGEMMGMLKYSISTECDQILTLFSPLTHTKDRIYLRVLRSRLFQLDLNKKRNRLRFQFPSHKLLRKALVQTWVFFCHILKRNTFQLSLSIHRKIIAIYYLP